MTVEELYQYFDTRIPRTLSCAWDNDGLLCCPDPARQVKRVLVSLDVTDAVVEEAINGRYDVILAHHPILFRPIKALTPASTVPRKLLRLACAGISVIGLHTRLDAWEGGVNEALAEILGQPVVGRFACEDALEGRIITLDKPMALRDFGTLVCQKLGCPAVNLADAGKPVQRIGLLGGEGGDFLYAARAAGCDTYLTGRAGYHTMLDAAEEGINLLEAGHFWTELPVCGKLCAMVRAADADIVCTLHTVPTLHLAVK